MDGLSYELYDDLGLHCIESLSDTLPDGDFDDFAIADEEEDQQVPGESLVSHVPTKLPPTQQAGEFDDALPAYGVGDNREEKHKDGTPHLHVALKFQEPISTRDMNYFDRVTGKHGNYQPMKSQRACVAYVTKAGEYDAYGIDVKAILAKKCGTFTTMAKELRSGKGLIISTIWIWLSVATQEEMRRILELEQQKKRKREQKTLDPLPDRRYRGLKRDRGNANHDLAQSEH